LNSAAIITVNVNTSKAQYTKLNHSTWIQHNTTYPVFLSLTAFSVKHSIVPALISRRRFKC